MDLSQISSSPCLERRSEPPTDLSPNLCVPYSPPCGLVFLQSRTLFQIYSRLDLLLTEGRSPSTWPKRHVSILMAPDYSPTYRAQVMELKTASVAVRQLFACPTSFVGMVAQALFVEAALTQPGSHLLARSFA